MRRLTNAQAYVLAGAIGAGLWIAVMAISGRREAWDSPLYWTAAYPAGIAVAGVLGYLVPERAWRWALVLMSAQAVVLALAAASFGLLPLGLIMFGILALPGAGVASLAAVARRRMG
jgi:anaerobic C4-dicarboxylate transporter